MSLFEISIVVYSYLIIHSYECLLIRQTAYLLIDNA